MKFSEMIKVIQDQIIQNAMIGDFSPHNLCYDSRIVEKGDLFFAVKGLKSDGNRYINDVLQKGAAAVVTDSASLTADPRVMQVKDIRKSMALLSSSYYGFPSSKMRVIGITGTNGKTTISSIIHHILRQSSKKSGLIGTNGNIINNRFIETSFTTPESVDLQRLLKDMADENIEFVTMEVSSHSLALGRVYGIDFDIAIFTNLTIDHLDFHGSMDNYFIAKKMLFDSLKRINSKNNRTTTIYNSDDEYGDKISASTMAERVSYGLNSGVYRCTDIEMDFSGTSFRLLVPGNGGKQLKIDVKTKLTGKFNVYNTIASIAAVKMLGLDYEAITNAIKTFEPVDGRFNQFKLNNGANAIIDYSHTPDSLLNAIMTIRSVLDGMKSAGKIIVVFGCGGNRDSTKRPIMGGIATEHSDAVIITSDNPRDEDPLEIINEIKTGIKRDNYSVIENREEAIKKAAELSRKEDVILIAGKGHEKYQEIKGVKHHFSDKEVIEKYM